MDHCAKICLKWATQTTRQRAKMLEMQAAGVRSCRTTWRELSKLHYRWATSRYYQGATEPPFRGTTPAAGAANDTAVWGFSHANDKPRSHGASDYPAWAASEHKHRGSRPYNSYNGQHHPSGCSNGSNHLAIVSNGEFVDFVELLPILEESSAEFSDKKSKEKALKRYINKLLTWLQAWSTYERLVMKVKPEVYNRLAEYRCLIQDCYVKYTWSSVYSYDVKFRTKLAGNPVEDRFDFDKIDTSLFMTVLDATAVKPRKLCYRCQSPNHTVTNCPFSASKAAMQTEKKVGNEKKYFQGKEICNNFQVGQCRFNYDCQRAHKCRQCYGPQLLYRCDTCQRPDSTGRYRWGNSNGFQPRPN